jgi:hypothetical protein
MYCIIAGSEATKQSLATWCKHSKEEPAKINLTILNKFMNRYLVFFLIMLCFTANLRAQEVHIGTAGNWDRGNRTIIPPAERPDKSGGYSAVIQSNQVRPEGGQILVDRTVELINSLWPVIK